MTSIGSRTRLGSTVDRSTALCVAGLDVLFFFLLLIAVRRLEPTLETLGTLVLLGIGLVLGLAVRATAAVFGTARHRSRHGLYTRWDAMPTVLAGAALGWLAIFVITLPAGAAALTPVALLQAPRWLLESAVGVLLVRPDPGA